MGEINEVLKKVAEAALEFDRCVTARRSAQENMSAAYSDWKEDRGITGRIEPGSGLYDAMVTGTAVDYDMLKKAKREENNARRRMERAVLKYRVLQAGEGA